MTRQDAETLRDLSKVLWDSQVWQVRLNIEHRFERGSSSDDLYAPEDLDEFCFDFHKPLPVPEKIRKHQRVGSLWINIANCGLRLQHQGKVLLNSQDSTAKILAIAPTMIGSRLGEVQIDNPGGDTRFVFDNDRTLTCFPANSRQGVSWVIATNDGNELKLGPGSRIAYETGLR